MEQAKYSTWHVQEAYPSLKKGTLHTWIKAGIINPAVPPNGQGFPARYSQENMIEIGIVLQLTKMGIDSHVFLRKLMQSPTQAGRPLIKYLQFKDFVILAGAPVFGNELTEEQKEEGPPPFFKRLDELEGFFKPVPPAGGWIVVDVRFIKAHVEHRLANL